jgi:hypothetical protein
MRGHFTRCFCELRQPSESPARSRVWWARWEAPALCDACIETKPTSHRCKRLTASPVAAWAVVGLFNDFLVVWRFCLMAVAWHRQGGHAGLSDCIGRRVPSGRLGPMGCKQLKTRGRHRPHKGVTLTREILWMRFRAVHEGLVRTGSLHKPSFFDAHSVRCFARAGLA